MKYTFTLFNPPFLVVTPITSSLQKDVSTRARYVSCALVFKVYAIV
jgi:hypothetical protein